MTLQQRDTQARETLGLIPAAGRAARLTPLPCSKEIYPVGWDNCAGRSAPRPKAVGCYLLEKMQGAGITKAYIVLREGKWDIPAYFRNGSLLDMRLSYLIAEPNAGPPYTLDEAYAFVRDAVVAFGFPDILFFGDDAFRRLLCRQTSGGADIILGLFPADQPDKMDMIDVDESAGVRDLVIQPGHTSLRYSWDIAVWTPLFTQFMHSYLENLKNSSLGFPEISMGHVIQAAIREGMRTEGIEVSDQPYCDMGTPEGLTRALERFAVNGEKTPHAGTKG